ncbi:presenilins-associated rhomboid-like protein, mitochondrial [Polistes fuscatus]|uniref:presenilins-associated rhomboid-like protein, mitochondrial n=1 Tax=Polistes fuscatus TaxID=30207 RepID=UPI001CA9F605|nr:presenilins-associated rhomboid-like protein, mitochondrial [Polistes fuscatus]XP_043500475.1 presenilins-associated rhomboid-like protein, mitochondrial [Polistes fuscatus]
MTTRTFMRLADATNRCVFMLPSHTSRLHVPNAYKNARGFKRLKDSSKQPESPFTSLEGENGPVHFSKLLKPFVFTITFTGTTLIATAILEYERIRKQTYKITNYFRQYYNIKTGWRKEMEIWWKSLTDGQRMFAPICFLNVLVFLAWRVPAFQSTMLRYFCANPASNVTCWPMILSAFSHYSLLHLAANMYVLHSFSTGIVAALGKEQFLALYLSSGVISNFASHFYKVAFGLPGLSLGASGAIMGILGFVCTEYPDTRLAIFFLPMFTFTASMAIKVTMTLDFTGCMLGWKYFDHAAHLGGALFGIFWQAWGNANIWRKREPVLMFWHELRNPRKSQ